MFDRTDDAARVALRTFWRLTAAVVVLDAFISTALHWPAPWHLLATVGGCDALLLAPLAFRRYRVDTRLPAMLRAAVALLTFTAAAGFLSYLATATAAPLVDAPLAAADRALGIDGPALRTFLDQHPRVAAALTLAYASGLLQLVVIVLGLGAARRPDRLAEFLQAFAVATLVAIAVSAWLPAAGAWAFEGTGTPAQLMTVSHFAALRAGTMQAFPLTAPQGLISMPSLHAASAVLFMAAARGSRWAWPAWALNGAMLASTPMSGGHYFVDVLAGVALAAFVLIAGSPAAQRRSACGPRVDAIPAS